jgi:hypothetical protein
VEIRRAAAADLEVLAGIELEDDGGPAGCHVDLYIYP